MLGIAGLVTDGVSKVRDGYIKKSLVKKLKFTDHIGRHCLFNIYDLQVAYDFFTTLVTP